MDLVCGLQCRRGRALQLLPCGCEWSPGCLRLSPTLTTPRRSAALRSLTWEDEKELQMFCVLLISRVCFSLSCAVFGTVWRGVDNLLLSHRLLSLPKRFGYVRNAASPNMFFLFLHSTTWFSCALRRGRDFSDFSFLTSCPDIVCASCSYRL